MNRVRTLVLDEVESTQDAARTHAAMGAPEITAILSFNQTSGRGRQGRTWASPAGKNIALSLLLRPAVHPERGALLGMLASVAVMETLADLGLGLNLGLKWPNDVLCSNRKIAGILSEASIHGNRLDFVIVGVGVNVNTRAGEFPASLKTRATSVYAETGRMRDLSTVAELLIERFTGLYDQALENDLAGVARLWEQRWVHKGRLVRRPDAVGTAEHIDASGALILRDERGKLLRITSGEAEIVEKIDTGAGA